MGSDYAIPWDRSRALSRAFLQTKLAGAPDFAGLLGKVVELTAWENELGNGGDSSLCLEMMVMEGG